MPSKFKGSASNPSIPDFAIPNKNNPNKAIAFDYELQATNQWAAVGVDVQGHPWQDGKLGADDVSSYKYLTVQLYVTGVTQMKVEVASQGHGIQTNGAPFFTFKVNPGFNTYRIDLKKLEQPSWAEPKISTKDLLKKLTSVKLIAFCEKCVPTRGTVVVDNLIFQN